MEGVALVVALVIVLAVADQIALANVGVVALAVAVVIARHLVLVVAESSARGVVRVVLQDVKAPAQIGVMQNVRATVLAAVALDVISNADLDASIHVQPPVEIIVEMLVALAAPIIANHIAWVLVPETVPVETYSINMEWNSGLSKTITFIVTKDCQLACRYCYLVGKNAGERMSLSTAKNAVDFFLNQSFKENSVVWEFIGGEPFIEIELIDEVSDYIKQRMFETNHKWFNSYRFNFSTNGINYHDSRVQSYIKKNLNHLSIGITIDGTKRKHDLNRIYKGSGKGSYDDVIKNIPLWLSQFPHVGTKVTISSDDIPFICESVLHLFSLGIEDVNINVVFENVWKEGDDVLFENQLGLLADKIIDEGLFPQYKCSFFSEHIGKPLDKVNDNQNWCGAGIMVSVDANGILYPCTRFAQYSLRSKKALTIGSIYDGINYNRLRPFLSLDRITQSKQECIECEVASGCAWCQGENYDAAETDTIFQRSTAICKMHKARVRANNYFWNKLRITTGM